MQRDDGCRVRTRLTPSASSGVFRAAFTTQSDFSICCMSYLWDSGTDSSVDDRIGRRGVYRFKQSFKFLMGKLGLDGGGFGDEWDLGLVASRVTTPL